MDRPVFKTAVRVILPIWLILKIVAALITFLSLSAVDLTFMNPAVELGFQSLVFVKNTAAGLGIFIGFVIITVVGIPASFLVIPDSRVQNIIGFFAYAVVLLTDIVSAFILIFTDGLFILSLILGLVMVFCLLYYGKSFLHNRHEDEKIEEEPYGEEVENNP